MTYYIDIQYYSELIWSTHQEEKDETIKVIVSGNDDSLNRPTLDISYNKTANSFTIKTGVPDYSIITGIAYFFSNDNLTIGTQNDFYKELQKSNERGTLLKTPSDEVSVTLKNSATSYRFLYVISETGNGYATISSYDMTPPSGGNSGGQNTNTSTNPNYTQTSTDDSNGVFDLPIGHVILIVLVIVLIVSCALIITQKIVDYKKRLY